MLGAVGDLVEDVVVYLERGPSGARDTWFHLGSDTGARVLRRQGGSAANVCVGVAGLGRPARFIGQRGGDPTGRTLEAGLRAAGVTMAGRRGGRAGTIIVLCHPDGERSMLTDRGSSQDLARPEPAWLDGLTLLHVPLYSLAGGPLAATAATLAGWARDRGAAVSVDLSSHSLLGGLGPGGLARALAALAPTVVLANEAEAAHRSARALLAGLDALTVVKRGPAPALVRAPGRPPVEVPALDLGPVPDTTGAGDAFAAGFLTATREGADPVAAAQAGHACAAARLAAQRDAGPAP